MASKTAAKSQSTKRTSWKTVEDSEDEHASSKGYKRTIGESAVRAGTAESSLPQLQQVKQECFPAPNRDDRSKMIAKLHYMKNTGNSKAYDEYQALDVNGKRAWFYQQYQMDPTLSRYFSTQKTRSIFRTDESQNVGEWLTERQIMAEQGYQDDKHPEYAQVWEAVSKDLVVRDHEKPEMAALGKKQYAWTKKMEVKSFGSKHSDNLVIEGELDQKDAGKMATFFDQGGAAKPDIEAKKVEVQIEPWKKDAMDLEKKLGAMVIRGDKNVRCLMFCFFSHTSTSHL